MNTPHLNALLDEYVRLKNTVREHTLDDRIIKAKDELTSLKKKAYSALNRAAKMDELVKFDIETRQIAEILNTDFEIKSGFFEYYLNNTYRYKYEDLDLEFVRKLHFEMLSDSEFNLFTKAKYAERWILK